MSSHIINAADLKKKYTLEYTEQIKTLSNMLIEGLSDFLLSRNRKKHNVVVIAFCSDKRLGGKPLYSAPDLTSPFFPIDLGIFKSNYGAVPEDFRSEVGEILRKEILGMRDKGYTVDEKKAWQVFFDVETTLNYGIQTHESFEPVECFVIGWSNG